jgi:hypothetical protein
VSRCAYEVRMLFCPVLADTGMRPRPHWVFGAYSTWRMAHSDCAWRLLPLCCGVAAPTDALGVTREPCYSSYLICCLNCPCSPLLLAAGMLTQRNQAFGVFPTSHSHTLVE